MQLRLPVRAAYRHANDKISLLQSKRAAARASIRKETNFAINIGQEPRSWELGGQPYVAGQGPTTS
jgi:hypothetical protein